MTIKKLTACLLGAVCFVYMPGGLPAQAKMSGGTTVGAAGGGGGGGPFPSTQTIAFGAKTLNLFGGSPMQYSTQSALGSTRWLKITAMTNESGTNIIGSPIFQLDDRQFLTPASTSSPSTYGGAWGQATQCDSAPYCSVTVTEYSNSGRTTPTGFSTVITARTDSAGVYTIRENTSTAHGCINPVTQQTNVNCEVTNPDFGGDGSQLNTVLYIALNRATDSVVMRDGFLNPSAEFLRVQPSNLWTGSGTIVVSSETKDIGTFDSFGNPRRANGSLIGSLGLDSFGWGNIQWTLLFDYVQFYQNVTTPGFAELGYNNSTGYGVSVTNSRLTQTCALTSGTAKLQLNGGSTANDNTFDSCSPQNGGIDNGANFSILADNSTNPVAVGLVALRNVFETPTADAIHVSGCGVDIEFNYIFGQREVMGGHADTLQNQGTAVNCAIGTIAYNINTTGPADSTGAGPQGIPFIKNDIGSTHWSSASIIDNINTTPSDSNCQFFTIVDNLTANGNLNLTNPQTTTSLPHNPCTFDIASGGTNGTFVGNINNGFDIHLQTGTIVNTHNIPLTFTDNSTGCSAIQAIYASFVCGDNSLDTNRPYTMNRFKPANRTVTANGDGTFFGPIWPQMDGGEWCFAVSATVVDFTKTCVQNGTIAIQ